MENKQTMIEVQNLCKSFHKLCFFHGVIAVNACVSGKSFKLRHFF